VGSFGAKYLILVVLMLILCWNFRLAELVKRRLMEVYAGRVSNVVVHVVPLGSAGLGEKTGETSRKSITENGVVPVNYFVIYLQGVISTYGKKLFDYWFLTKK
jgi:hypothetical protein